MRLTSWAVLPTAAALSLACLLVAPGAPRGEPAEPEAAAPPAKDGRSYTITSLVLRYAEPHADHPPLDEISASEVEVGHASDGFVALRDGTPRVAFPLAAVPDLTERRFHASAIRSINRQIVEAFNRRGLIGVLVEPDEEQIARRTGDDLRAPDQTALDLLVWTGRVVEIRTFASGGRVPDDQRLDHPAHARILENSPVKPDGEHDLMRKDLLDDYAAFLNRHPGRRVDMQVSPTREPGGVYLDYLVAEHKPWFAYSEVSNTGTESTTEWRQRFGFMHTQLFGRDDLFAVDYITGDFDTYHSIAGYYEAPIPRYDRLRARAFGGWSKYDASVFGFAGNPFKGDEWGAGGELIFNVFQREKLFIDLIGGARFARIHVDNQIGLVEGEDDFVLPQWGVRGEHVTDTAAVVGAVIFEHNLSGVAGTEDSEIFNLGRFPVDKDWTVMRWDSALWFYLEPLLFRDSWKDPSTPFTSTLAHEVFVQFRGQYSFGNRLIPQELYTVGGQNTVRGYKEAVTSGDSAGVVTAEYRLHIPRLFRPNPDPAQVPVIGGFYMSPRQVYARPDWDLILRAFVDAGRAVKADRTAIESNETLVGTGVGVEVLLKRNISARLDWGWALHGVKVPKVNSGSQEARFVVRVLY